MTIQQVGQAIHENYREASWYYTTGIDEENGVIYIYGKRRPPRCVKLPVEFQDFTVKLRVIGDLVAH